MSPISTLFLKNSYMAAHRSLPLINTLWSWNIDVLMNLYVAANHQIERHFVMKHVMVVVDRITQCPNMDWPVQTEVP